MKLFAISPPNNKWVALPSHRAWLLKQAEELFDFFERSIINPLGGFYDLDDEGRPAPPGYGAGETPARYLFATSQIVHAFAIAHLMGRPGAADIVDHGMDFLWKGHRNSESGGYYWGVGYNGPTDTTKQAYGHAFVLLAASSAMCVGHPDAENSLSTFQMSSVSGSGKSNMEPLPRSSRGIGVLLILIAARTRTCT